MASIFKPSYTKKDPLTGTKTKRKLSKWYVKFRDHHGVERKVPGFKDKAATLQLAAKLERDAELGKLGIADPHEKQRKRPLSEHLDEFEAHLRDKGDTGLHVDQTAYRAKRVVEGASFRFISDISASGVEGFLSKLRASGRSIETSNHYLAAVKAFCRWMVMDRRTGDNAIAHLKKLNVKTDRRHDRRALEPGDFEKLINSAMTGPVVEGMPGADRAMLYILAAWTGYRRGELSSLTLRSLLLEQEPAVIRVEAGYSKRRRQDEIPLHPVVVERLTAWLAQRPNLSPDELLFVLRTPKGHFRKTAKMMKKDLERAGLPYQDEDGLFADFHSNRHTFISTLGRSGVQPKVAQVLARHSDINLTMNTYTHLGVHDHVGAIHDLPAPPSFGPTVPSPSKADAAVLKTTGKTPEHAHEDASRHVQKHVQTTVSARPDLSLIGSDDGSGNAGVVSAEVGFEACFDGVCPASDPSAPFPDAPHTEVRCVTTEPKVAGSSPAGCNSPNFCRTQDVAYLPVSGSAAAKSNFR